MLNKEISSFVIFDAVKQVVRKDQETRVKAILERDYDEFKRIRDYAIDNMDYLHGRRVPIEVDSIQRCDSHNCIIINDLLLLSYTEATEMIVAMKERDDARRKLSEGSNGSRESVH